MAKAQYCPKCLNSSLYLKERGVIELLINGKQMDSGRFLFNIEKSSRTEIYKELYKKMEDFFKWYIDFKNRVPIETVELCSADFKCESCGFIPNIKQRQSIIDILVPKKIIEDHIKELSVIYKVELKQNFFS